MDGNNKIKLDANVIKCKIFKISKEKENKEYQQKWKLLHDSYIILKYKVVCEANGVIGNNSNNVERKGNLKDFIFFDFFCYEFYFFYLFFIKFFSLNFFRLNFFL